MLVNIERLISYLDKLYQTFIKPSIILIFKLYYSRYPNIKPQRVNNSLLFYSANKISNLIRDKQVNFEIL